MRRGNTTQKETGNSGPAWRRVVERRPTATARGDHLSHDVRTTRLLAPPETPLAARSPCESRTRTARLAALTRRREALSANLRRRKKSFEREAQSR